VAAKLQSTLPSHFPSSTPSHPAILAVDSISPALEPEGPANDQSAVLRNGGLGDFDLENWDLDYSDGIFSVVNTESEFNCLPSQQNPTFLGISPTAEAAADAAAHLNSFFGSDTAPNSEVTLREYLPGDDWVSAIHIAAQKGNDRILQLLIQQNVDINEKDSDEMTPLMYAVVEGHEAFVVSLLTHGARINEVDLDRRSALHWAVLHKRERILKILLEQHAKRPHEFDINAYDESGWTAIHMALSVGFEAGIPILLQYGASLEIKARRCPNTTNILPGLLSKKTSHIVAPGL
jgi:hypothetical protein